MISLSREWAILSSQMYGQEFIDELADFLNEYGVRTILECGCGDGHVLYGLAQKGFCGIGIDSDSEMIKLALENNKHQNISYKEMSWLDIWKLNVQFDAVMCRGNSLSSVVSWGKEHIPSLTKQKLEQSICLFFNRLKDKGLLYVDTCSQGEIDRNGGKIEINTRDIHLIGQIEYDKQEMERRVFGSGSIFGEKFSGGSASYLLYPTELEELIKANNPSCIWHKKLVTERNYDIICAIK